MDDTAVALYMPYKTQPKDQKLMRLDSASTEVLDILDQPIFCLADWRDPGNCNQFLSATTQIHNSINQSGQYFPVCDGVVDLRNSRQKLIAVAWVVPVPKTEDRLVKNI
jgi:hypothetical protein